MSNMGKGKGKGNLGGEDRGGSGGVSRRVLVLVDYWTRLLDMI